MAHALPSAGPGSAVAPVASVPGAMSLANDGVYLPKDAFISLLNLNAGTHGVSGGAALDSSIPRRLAQSVPASYPPSFPYSSPLLPTGYDDVRYGPYHYGPMVGHRPYDMRQDYHLDRDRYGHMMELGYHPYYHAARGRFQGRKRKKGEVSSDEEDEMSFPGDSDYSKPRKRLRPEKEHSTCGFDCEQRHGRYEEIKDALSEIRRDLAAARSAMQMSAAPMSTSLSPTSSATSSCQDQNLVTEKKSAEKAPVASTSAMPTVNASCGPLIPPKERPQNMLDLNRRLFVAALNKME
ncbi:capsid scaffold protein [Saimiriine betaherpesvirus 4]|nr:capsid scaffold protein [Saimiriine betaherpesvirus 4]AEV80932.1 capsid scaffold protein [Saimiriine betaherpesvirus 4]